MKLQIAGLPFDAGRQVVRGDPEHGAFAVFHLNGDRIVCVEAVNAPGDFMGGRQLIGKGVSVDAELLADPAISIKSVVKSTRKAGERGSLGGAA